MQTIILAKCIDFEKENVVYQMYRVSKGKCCLSDIQILIRQMLCITCTDFEKLSQFYFINKIGH